MTLLKFLFQPFHYEKDGPKFFCWTHADIVPVCLEPAKSYWAALGQKWRSVVRYKHVSFGSSAGVASSKPGSCFWPLNDYPRR